MSRSKGNVDEMDSDPLPLALFAEICRWSLESNNIFVWTWNVVMWNLMCRPISVDPLGFHNFGMGGDCTKIKYDATKADQKGEKVTWKNIYDNTNHPCVSINLSLGCWLALKDPKFKDGDKIFLNKEAQKGTASHRYCTQLMKLLQTPEKIEMIKEYMRNECLTAYSMRKGGAVTCTSDAVDCLSFVSVCQRGDEWNQGKVFEAYFQWANGGDLFAGRGV